MNKTLYQTAFERHWTALLGMLRYLITQFADESVEVAARAVALAAPLPNAINMYNVGVSQLGWSQPASFAFAMTLEIVVFLLVEIALLMWDGYLADKQRYTIPLGAAVGIVLVSVAVVMIIVYQLEAHKIMALLPVVSLCSFVGIGLKRWNERNQTGVDESDQLDNLRTALETERNRAEKFRIDAEALRNGADEMRNKLEALCKELEGERNRAHSVDINSVMSKLDDGSREVLAEIIRLVAENRITSAADVAKAADANKTKVYEMFRLANAIGAIYPNGDGAFHVCNVK
jgi:archaellum component FlaC